MQTHTHTHIHIHAYTYTYTYTNSPKRFEESQTYIHRAFDACNGLAPVRLRIARGSNPHDGNTSAREQQNGQNGQIDGWTFLAATAHVGGATAQDSFGDLTSHYRDVNGDQSASMQGVRGGDIVVLLSGSEGREAAACLELHARVLRAMAMFDQSVQAFQ